jgi:CheY-like chemotaxis protein
MLADPARVLIIDDDGLLRAMLGLTLQHQGYNVRTAASGWDGLMSAVAWNPRLIVVDVAMPEMSGTAFVEALRKRPQLADVPVLLISGYDQPEAAASAQVAFLSKPFETSVFSRLVRELLAKAAPANERSVMR